MIRDGLETDFKEFLDIRNYVKVQTTTVNIIDGVVDTLLSESPNVNRHYEDANRPIAGEDLTGSSTYHLQLALTHHDLSSPQDYQSFARRFRRLHDVLAQGRKKICFYIHPIIGVDDYGRQKDALLDEFTRFGDFLATRYTNISGLFFIVVKLRGPVQEDPSTLILETASCSVYVIYANKDFIDANAPFTGDCEREIRTMTDIVQQAALSRPARYKVYFPLFDNPESASNEMRLTHEGLLAHPQVRLVDRPDIADYVIFCQNHLVDHNPFHIRFRPIKDKYKHKTIMLDYGDDPGMVFDADDFDWRLYFKRSCVDRQTGRVMSYGGLAVRPTAYCAVDDICEPPVGHDGTRTLDLSCLFDDSVIDTPHFTLARGRLLRFAKRFAAAHPGLSMQIGTVSECGPVGRSSVDPRYKQCLYDSKIVLHANPDPWEGDSRLWEALASGALVFVDRLHAPIANPLIDGEHLVFYDLTDEGMDTLERKLLHYLGDDVERQRLGMQGRDFVLGHHRSLDRVSEILREVECTSPTTATYATMATPAPDVVVSIATGYKDIDQYRQFVSTLRRTGATCPVLLGISDGPEYEPVKRYLLDNSVNTFIVPPITPPHKVVNGYRFAQYRQWLKGLAFRYALMMDFRDAYFQRDPFVDVDRFMQGSDLYLMSEFQLLTVGNHPNGMNYAWVEEPFGKEAADAIKDKVILNSGAILGRKAAVMKLLDTLTEVTTSQRFDFADQGTLNYLAHSGRLAHCGRIKIAPAGESLVNNCGFTELDLLRATRPVSAEEEARIAFIPRTEAGRLKLYRDHDGWVLDDDGNVSYAVHQYDRFYPEIHDLVSRLSDYTCPDRVYVNGGARPYRGEKYTLSSRQGLKPDAVERLMEMINRRPVDKKPLLVLNSHFKRGFVFAFGVLNVDLLFASEAVRQHFFDPSCEPPCDAMKRSRFLDRRGYEVVLVEEASIFLAPETPPSFARTARSFSEARAGLNAGLRRNEVRAMTYDYVVVGAGLFGSVFAREATDAGKSVLILEKRDHIGGNCYTYEFEDTGITVPLYGPHIFHTDSLEIWNYVRRFTDFNRYQHRPLTTHANKVYTLPINLGTINAFYGVNLKPSEVGAFIRARLPVNVTPTNFEEKAISLVGPDLYNAFFKGYSTKQWKTDLTKLPAELITRLPVRHSYYDSYYDDPYQGMPLNGYTAIFDNLLKNIPVELNTDFIDDKDHWLSRCCRLIYTGPVDEYFDCCYGRLRWGSVRFETESLGVSDYQGTSVMNFADLDVPYTRIVEPKHFHRERKLAEDRTIIIREYSCFDPLKPYYPVRLSDDLELLTKYQALASREPKVTFGGRLAEYKYYDMDDVIARALRAARQVMS